MCRAPRGREQERAECEAAGGTFLPHVFGWMVHMYPWESSADAIWSVERQAGDMSTGREHGGAAHH